MSSLRNLFSTSTAMMIRRVGLSSCRAFSSQSSYSPSTISAYFREVVGVNRRFSLLSSLIVPPTPEVSSSKLIRLVLVGRCSSLHTSASLKDSFKIQDEEDFNKRVLKSSKPVVVQFHATWCAPCKQLSPRLEKCIALTKEAVDLALIDIDDNPDIAMSYSVGAVPAVMAIKDGKVVDKFIGLKDEDQVDQFIQKLTK